ncbi:MAG: hypothetical protein WC005_07065 [Candidatus Nanopelagicales bacterium]
MSDEYVSPQTYEADDSLESFDDSAAQSNASDDDGIDIDADAVDEVMVLEEHDNSLVLPVWEPTGDPEVDAALEELASLDELSIHDHGAVFTSVHERLHQRLTDISA